MKRNFDAPMLTLDGKPYEDNATLKSVCIAAIGANTQSDQQQPVAEKLSLFALATRIVKGGVVEVDPEDLVLLEKRVGAVYPALIMGEAYRLLRTDYVEPPAA